MTEKRFKMKKLEYFIDSQQEYVDEDEPNFKIDGEKTMSDSQILDLLNENEQLKQREENLLSEIDDFQELLSKNDGVCHKKLLQLLDDKISFLYKAKAEMINVDEYRYTQIAFTIQILRELKKELSE